LALATIRDKLYFQSQFASFPDYCRAKWDYTRRYADMLIAAAQAFTYLRTNCSQLQPERESQARPLTALPKEQALMAWNLAVEKAAGRKITA
jgi:hypothetical protein